MSDTPYDAPHNRPARVEPSEWRDPEDAAALTRGADGKRRARTVKGFRVADPILHLHRRSPGEVTERHWMSSCKLRDDYEAHLGASGGRDPGRIIGEPSYEPATFQIDAIGRVRDAFLAVGPTLWGVLLPVVIHGYTVARLAEARGTSAHRMQGYLVAALDRLADHYYPPKERATIVPQRVDDGMVDGLPAERVGRWTRPEVTA